QEDERGRGKEGRPAGGQLQARLRLQALPGRQDESQGAQEYLARRRRRASMIWRVRRVLTGHDSDGRSTFIADGLAPNLKEMKPTFPGLALTDLWETKGAPASNAGDADAADR